MIRIRIENLKTGKVSFRFIPKSEANKLRKYRNGLVVKGNLIKIEG